MLPRLVTRRVVQLFGIAILALTGIALPACNTVEGAGEDIEDLGDNIDDAAEDAED